jgi:MFS family permease
MGAVLAASLIPSLVLGFFSGAFIDRYHRKIFIVGTDVLRGVIIGLFAVLFYFDFMNFYLILTIQALLSVNAAFFDPAVSSVIPGIVPDKDLAAANSRHQFVNGFSTIAGAVLGGICIAAIGYFWVFVVNAVSFLMSAGFEWYIEIPHTPKQESKASVSGLMADMRQGYGYILSRQSLMVLIFMVMVIHFFVGSMEVFMPVIAHMIPGGGARTLGFFQAALGGGTVLTAMVLGVKSISGREKLFLFGSVFSMGLVFVSTSFLAGQGAWMTPLFCAVSFLFGCCIISASVSFKTLLQKIIDNAFAGRVFAVAGSVGNGSIPGAMIVYGILLEKHDFQGLLMVSGLVLMVLSLVSFTLYKEEKLWATRKNLLKKPHAK